MKKVLVLTYYFPPCAGVHVQRISKTVKYFRNFGIEPIVLTTRYSSPKVDNILAEELSDVKRYYCYDIGKHLPTDLLKLFRLNCVPDKKISWQFSVVKKALKIVKAEKIDFIFASAPPHSVGYIAGKIARKSKLNLYLDFRDEWITFPLFHRKKNQAKQIKMYHELLESCTAFTTVNRTLQDRIANSIRSKNMKSKVIYNGFDESDLPYQNNDKKSTTKIRIAYFGRFKKISNPKPFLKILDNLLKKSEQDRKEVEFICIGDKKNNIKWVKAYSYVLKNTRFTGYLSLKKAYKLLSSSDLGLVLLNDYSESSALPSKVYDYLALNKPILAFVEKRDELMDFLVNYGNSLVVLQSELEDKKDLVINFIHNAKKINTLQRNNNFKNRFNRKYQTKLLSSFLLNQEEAV